MSLKSKLARKLTAAARRRRLHPTPAEVAVAVQLFIFQWLARSDAASIFLLFTHGSRRRLFIDQLFFEQTSTDLFSSGDSSPLQRNGFQRFALRTFGTDFDR